MAEVATLLAINCAHYQSKFGVQLLDETIDLAGTDKPDAMTAKLLSEGMQNLCAVMGIVTGDASPDSLGH